MGFIDISRPRPEQRQMDARDFIWLAILGTAARNDATLTDVADAIDAITSGQWMPVSDLIAASMDEMTRGGHLVICQSGPEDRYALTPCGRQILLFLLALPLGRPGSLVGQVGLKLKLAFLDLAGAEDRRQHLQAVIILYEDEVDIRLRLRAHSLADGGYGELWNTHDMERLRRDLALLRSMAGMALPPA